MNLKNLKNYGLQFVAIAIVLLFPQNNFAQAEFTTWGNLTGIRVDKQLMEFNSSLAVTSLTNNTWRTRKEGQQIDFKRQGKEKVFTYDMDGFQWTQKIETTGKNKARVRISFSSPADTLINGAFFSIALPKEFGEETMFSLKGQQEISINEINSEYPKAKFKAPAAGIHLESPTRSLEVQLKQPTEIIIEETQQGLRVNFVLASGSIEGGKTYANEFTITATGEIDRSPVSVKIYPEQQGKVFDGIGGNFRIQNPEVDPAVIAYNLDNLNVIWGRVEMPWWQWHMNMEEDPAAEARKGNLHPKVKAAMEMARELDQRDIPVMLAAWFPPDWAIIGERFKGQHPDGSMGNLLDMSKKEEIYASLTSYVKFLKKEYGVEAVMFSFNESDLGIDVRQTAEEHNDLIKELGKQFREAGLNTEFLLGDTADANGWEFTTPASTDPEAIPYIGGVSFHSWRGYTPENLLKWRDISNRVQEPLFVGEGSIDAGAWRYPEIFEEPTYALDEIDIYLQIMNIAQPKSILQWQLTADYSVLSGGGVFGNKEEELYPTQRFFNLKQLGSTPEKLFALPVVTNSEDITVAALGDSEKGMYAVHLVNKGASREISISGFPPAVKNLSLFITSSDTSFEKLQNIPVKNGTARFQLEGASFMSLLPLP